MKGLILLHSSYIVAIFSNFILSSFAYSFDPNQNSEEGLDAYENDRNDDEYGTGEISQLFSKTYHNQLLGSQQHPIHKSRRTRNQGWFDVCSATKSREIVRSLENLRCKPNLKTVKLKLPGPNFELIPSMARVKRCDGMCHHHRACVPTKKAFVTHPVFQIDRANSMESMCVDFQLEEHVECACGCHIKSSHCSEKQEYDEGKCACICKNLDEKQRCIDMPFVMNELHGRSVSRFWDHKKCECACETLDCPSPLVWVPSLCRCIRIDETENAISNDKDFA